MASTDMAYTGHDSIHVGLQRHSMGDFYPWICVVWGDGAHSWLHGCTGEESPSFATYKGAVAWLEGAIKARAEMGETRR